MKKTLLFLLTLFIVNSCSTRKKKSDSTFLKGFYTYYNTLFNSKEALETELRNRDKAHKDNFYAPYIQILTYDNQDPETDLETEALGANDNFFGSTGGSMGPAAPGMSRGKNNANSNSGASILQISEAKALKAIEKYSILKGGVEKNKKIFEAHILLAKSRIYQDKPLEALDGLNYLFSNMRDDKRMPLAKTYQALAFSKMGDFTRSEEVFAELKKDKLKKSYRKLVSIFYSEMLLSSGQKEKAVDELEEAYAFNKNKKLRSRIAFLRGQILANLGKNEEARESFVTAYKNSNNFEFEVKSQIEIAKTFNGSSDDYEGARQYLEKISKKGTYASRKNEFYYALGLMASKAGKKDEAKAFFAQSLKEKMSDPQIRGLDYFEIGKSYFEASDYLAAGAFYDSALSVMTYQPSKILLQEKSKNIKEVSRNYYLIRKNDSILALTKMPEAERITYFTKIIDDLKTKEAAEELALKRAERSKGFDTGDYAANSLFASETGGFQDFGGGKGGFYFNNQSTVAKGQSSFKQLWGSRSLNDNWRTSARSNSIEDLKSEAMGIGTAPDPRRLEPSFYIEKIPTNSSDILALKKARDTASLGLGRMYENYFSDTPLATKTLYELVDSPPEDELRLQALYQIFAINYEKNAGDAERAKQMILSDFPYTSYAEFVKNPKNNSFGKSSEEVEKVYSDAFELYSQEKYVESKGVIEGALEKYPKDGLVPKFALLDAFNSGKIAGKEIMILQLEQIALNYAKTREGEKAAEMLKYLKSDLQVEKTDDSGNKVNAITNPVEDLPQKTLIPPFDGSSQEIRRGPPNPPSGDSKVEVEDKGQINQAVQQVEQLKLR